MIVNAARTSASATNRGDRMTALHCSSLISLSAIHAMHGVKSVVDRRAQAAPFRCFARDLMNLDGIRVLLVEDNPGDARLFTELVRETGAGQWKLVQVDRLSAALDLLKREPFDVMLLDLSLPDVEGLETLIRAHTEAPKIPIVVLTGHDDEALAVRAVRAGAQDYLVKGRMDGDLLVRSIRYASERGRAIEALERREEHYRSLIENSMDLISILSLDGTIRYASPSHERMLGYPLDELVGTECHVVCAPR